MILAAVPTEIASFQEDAVYKEICTLHSIPAARWGGGKVNEKQTFLTEFFLELKLIGLLDSNMVSFRMNIQGTESWSFRLLHKVSL